MEENGYPTPAEIVKIKKDIERAQKRLAELFEKRYEIIKKIVEEAPACKPFSLRVIELRQAFAHIEMLAKEEFLSWEWENAIHGGITAFIIDTTIGAALKTLVDIKKERIATLDLDINYLSPIKVGETVCSKAWFSRTESLDILRLRSKEKKLLHLECSVIAKPERREVARGNAWFVVFGRMPKPRKSKIS